MFKKETYIQRREALKKAVGTGLLLFMGNDEAGCNFEDNLYPYRQDSTFLYYFGLPYAGLMAVIDIDENREIIFGDELTIDAIVWMGVQPTLHEKSEAAGIKDVRPSAELRPYLEAAARKGQPLRYLPTYRPEHRIKLLSLLGIMPGAEQPSVEFIKAVVNMRNYKSDEEIAEIERACNVTADMHLRSLQMVRPGMRECEVAAAVQEVAAAHNFMLSFPTIATVHGETLHNHDHSNVIRSGQLFLLDAGAETEMGYAGDMSSTVPADPKFTARQKEMFEIQLASHEAAVKALRPGIRFEEVYDLSAEVIVEGMKSAGLMKGDAKEAVKAGAHALFFPHGLGHMMGLDVHDMENLGEAYVGYGDQPKSKQFGRKSLRLARELEPGFVLTIEPGIYFIPQLIDSWHAEKRFADFINYDKVITYKDFGGIRNEEDYLITADGARLLGKKILRHADALEELRKG